MLLLMAELRLTQVVYPIIYRVLAPSKRWLVGNGISEASTVGFLTAPSGCRSVKLVVRIGCFWNLGKEVS